MHEFTLQWSLLIDLKGTDPEEVKRNLVFVLQMAHEEGWITGQTTAELENDNYEINYQKEPK